MRKERKHFTPEEKVAILRRHLVDKVPVSELCEELALRPTMFYRWQKELFENGVAAFHSQGRPHRQVEEIGAPAGDGSFAGRSASSVTPITPKITMSWGLSFLCIPCATACADMIVIVNA